MSDSATVAAITPEISAAHGTRKKWSPGKARIRNSPRAASFHALAPAGGLARVVRPGTQERRRE
ncbi:hypothetical protein ACGFRB_13295 [Streptomyces sp. NPDC048718]|uniref:hypothetical protein n=1 Tax=Streptomyces sp. NPDC048718 TaxID=3365587 RepID=UPI00371ABC18